MSLSNLRYSLIEIRQSESKSHYGNESKQLDPIYAGWLKSTKNPKSLTRMKSRTEMRKTYLENQIKIVKISNQSVSMQNSICFTAYLVVLSVLRGEISFWSRYGKSILLETLIQIW